MLIPKGFNCCFGVSVDVKAVAGTFFVSVDVKPLSRRRVGATGKQRRGARETQLPRVGSKALGGIFLFLRIPCLRSRSLAVPFCSDCLAAPFAKSAQGKPGHYENDIITPMTSDCQELNDYHR